MQLANYFKTDLNLNCSKELRYRYAANMYCQGIYVQEQSLTAAGYFWRFNAFLTNVPISYSLKTLQNILLSDVFRGYETVTLAKIDFTRLKVCLRLIQECFFVLRTKFVFCLNFKKTEPTVSPESDTMLSRIPDNGTFLLFSSNQTPLCKKSISNLHFKRNRQFFCVRPVTLVKN